jgi:DNA polymerase-1
VRVKEVLGLTDAFGLALPKLSEAEAGDDGLTAVASEGFGESKEEIDPKLLRETALALSVLDSNIPEPTIEDILQFANTESFSQARETILGEIEKRNLSRVYKEIELPLIPILDSMHTYGIKVDTDYLKELSKEYHKELDKLQKEIYKHAGEEFNINSPKQLGEILFVKMGLKAKGQKKTAGGAMSTRESELEKLKELHPIIECILDYRELQKLLSTYIDNLPNLVEKDGRVHTRYVSIGAATGRMASKDPNLQNIPIKSELGRNIRKAFIAEKGFKLASLDYSQIELRLAAILSDDKQLIEIFKSGRDVHTEVAARVFKVPAEKVDKEMRRKAKIINFGILYGMGVNALKANLGKETKREEAQAFYDEYFNTFKELAMYLDKVKAEAARTGYTETMFGRKRYFEGIKSKIPFIRAAAERTAINAPIQGSQADIIKIAMIRIADYIDKQKLHHEARMLLQIHDELIFEIKEKEVESFTEKVREIMQDVLTKVQTKGVPILANCNVGQSWGEMQEA